MVQDRIARWASALPDAVTSAFFLSVWIAPAWWGAGAIRTGMLMMLVEFILLHATAMLGSMLLQSDGDRDKRRHRLALVASLGGFYLLFIAAWSYQFRAWWPLLAFGWLLLGKAWQAFQPLPGEARRRRMQSDWAIGAMAYLAGVFLTVFVPVPRLGMSGAIVAEAGLPGGGLWVSQPQTVIAFGAFYFAVLAITKARGTLLRHAQHAPG